MRLRAEYLAKNPYCEYWLAENGYTMAAAVNGGGWVSDRMIRRMVAVPLATEIHHRKHRGKYLLDVSTWMAVADEGHRLIHDDPKRSYERGYLIKRND